MIKMGQYYKAGVAVNYWCKCEMASTNWGINIMIQYPALLITNCVCVIVGNCDVLLLQKYWWWG